jgi:hypothetical protein
MRRKILQKKLPAKSVILLDVIVAGIIDSKASDLVGGFPHGLDLDSHSRVIDEDDDDGSIRVGFSFLRLLFLVLNMFVVNICCC